MDDVAATEDGAGAGPQSSGAMLRVERERQELTLKEVAQRTRVPMRHLEAIEASDFETLPGRTYVVGFTRSYAYALGLDPDPVLEQLDWDMEASGAATPRRSTADYEPIDATRIPPRAMTWGALGVLILLVAAYAVWRASSPVGNPVDDPPQIIAADEGGIRSAESREVAESKAADAEQPSADGQVVLTATGEVWLRVYEADGERLYQNTLQKGDRYEVPKDARNPQILTGRPDALTVTIDGRPVPSLGEGDLTIADYPIDAASLTAREAGTGG